MQHWPPDPTRPRYVYFARSRLRPGLIKIGRTMTPHKRMLDLEAEAVLLFRVPFGWVNDGIWTEQTDKHVEKLLHRQYAHLRIDRRREWFRAEQELAHLA